MKNLKYLIVFFLAFFLSANSFAVDLIVGGTHATYTDMNGTYKPYGTVNGYSAWKHETLSYYIWYYPYFNTWVIDNNTTYDGVTDFIFFNDQDWKGGASPTAVVNWSDQDNNKQDITVSEVSLNPEIDIRGNSTSIVSGDASPSFADYTKFGSALSSGGTATRTFTIQNTGAAALTLGTISFTGTNAAEFSVTSSPTSPVAATSGSTTFTVRFAPTGTGSRNATISIGNNDSNENPYTFAINGYGYSTKTLVVSGITTPSAANGNYIHQGVLNNFEYWKHATENYYIYNYADGSGIRSWTIDNNQIGTDGSFFYKPFSEDVTPTGLTFSAQNGTGSPVISETTPAPEINLVGNNSQSITSGDNTPQFYDGTNFGTLDYASGTRTRTFTIQNTGTAALTISGTTPYVTITGTNAADFAVTTPPSPSVAASGSTTFVVTFNPSSVGTKTATINIGNNDSDEGTYTFSIQGDGITPKNLVVSNLTTPSEANGTYIYQGILNEFQYWRHSSGSYYIYNNIPAGYSGHWYIDTNTDPVAYNFNSDNNGENASPVTVTSWSVLSGNVGSPIIIYAEPEINVTGNSVTIMDGDATPSIYDYSDLGWITSGSITRTYTIQNLGIETLTLTGTSPYVIKGGTDASQFSITTPPAATIAAGGSTTFQVTFTPTASLGVRTATLSIANTDTDENPYNFSIQAGLGISPVVTTQAVGSISSTTATGNGNVTTLGSPNPTSHGICWNTTGTPTTADGNIDNGTKSSTGVFTAAMTSLTPNTTYYVRAFVTNNVGTTYGSEVTFTTSPVAPTVTTQAVSSITATTATGNGNIASLGVPNPTAYGVCWSTTSGAETATGNYVNNGSASGAGAFTASITGLAGNTTYYVKAYATNTAGTSYGSEVIFTTLPVAPTVTTQAVSSITATTATGNGTITSLGVPNPTAYGVCWNTGGTPTTSDSKADNGTASATGAFTASIIGLTANTTYHVRAYATNTAGTSYGTEVTFTTSGIAPTVTTQAVSSITATTATGNGTITSLGVPNPTAYGVCWNTGGTPTTSDSKADNGAASATGAFTASITGLNANTTYHVRAYATNTAGTSYGTEVTFTTSAIAPTVTTQAVSSITATTATGNGNITSLGVPNPTAYGVCWSTTSGAETATGNYVNNGSASGAGAFTASITGLNANTTYHVRAFATNTAGTSYGNEVSFTTSISTGLDVASTNALSLYPNPATDGFTIQAGEKATTVSIYNLSGSLVLSQQIIGKSYINISSLQQGIYVVKVDGLVGKLVKK